MPSASVQIVPENTQLNGYFVHEVFVKKDAGQSITIKVSGDRDLSYGSTAKMIAQAGLALAFDVSKTEKMGRVYTPAAIFGERLLTRLQWFSGLTFEVVV